MTRFQTRKNIQGLSCSQRFQTCGRPISSKIEFSALNFGDYTTAVSSGRASCRSVLCPSCRPGKMVKRKHEVQAILDYWRKNFKTVSMLTFTAPHYASIEPSDFFGSTRLRTGLSGAIALLKQSQWWKKNVKGYVSVLESTFGAKNGVHSHYHVVVATDALITESEIYLSSLWQEICLRAGLGKPSLSRGLTIQNASKVAEYISKWSIESEMAGSHVKDAKNGNITLSQLENLASEGHPWARDMLKSYYSFMYRRRNITYSRNLSAVRQEYKDQVESSWSLVPIFSIDRRECKVSCESEEQIKSVLKSSDFSTESLELLSQVYSFNPVLPDFDKSVTPESRNKDRDLKELLKGEFYNINILLDLKHNPQCVVDSSDEIKFIKKGCCSHASLSN